MLVLFPLTAKQAKSMMAMQRAQPEIKRLQAKYKGDRQKLNEEMMKYYQENKINPLAGCLPLLVQMPIFFALFRVMHEPYKHVPKTSDLYAAFCTNAAGKVVGQATVREVGAPEPALLPRDGPLAERHRRHGGFLDALPYFILVGLVIPPGSSRPARAGATRRTCQRQMAMITRVLPIVFGVFSLQFPAGLVLYFLVSNLWRLGQQELIMRKITRPGMAADAAASRMARSSQEPTPADGRRRRAGCASCSSSPRRTNGAADERSTARQRPPQSAGPTAKQPGLRDGRQGSSRQRRCAQPEGSGAPASGGSSSRRTNKKRKRRWPRRRADRAAASAAKTGEIPWSGWRQPDERSRPRSTRRSTSSGVDEDDVEYEVLQEPKTGLFGRLGGNRGAGPRPGEADLAGEAGRAPAPQPTRASGRAPAAASRRAATSGRTRPTGGAPRGGRRAGGGSPEAAGRRPRSGGGGQRSTRATPRRRGAEARADERSGATEPAAAQAPTGSRGHGGDNVETS